MSQRDDDTVLHQREHESVVDERLDGVTVENTAIDDLEPITGGQSPTEAEHNLVLEAVNDILAALRSSQIIPTEQHKEGK